MPTPTQILTAFRADLVAAGLVRRPSEAGVLPPCHIEPADGAPAPGEREGIENDAELVVSLFHSGDFAEDTFDTYRRRAAIDVRYRSIGNTGLIRAAGLDAAIRSRLTSPDRNYGLGFALSDGTFIYQAVQFGGFGPLERGRTGNGAARFTNGAKYVLEAAAG